MKRTRKEKNMGKIDERNEVAFEEAVERSSGIEPSEPMTESIESETGFEEEPTMEEWRLALEKTVAERDEYLSLAQRTQADFQNYRRRTAQSRADGYEDGVCEALTALLSTIDNLDRAIDAASQSAGAASLLEGVEMTKRLMMDSLLKLGLEEVPALNQRFDPSLHNAVMRSEEGEPGYVTEVFQKGYRVKERIIRYAMVKVAAE